MKRYPILSRSLLWLGLASVIAMMMSVDVSVAAQTQLSATLGFENRTTPGRYAPLRVDIRNLPQLENVRLHITQPVGNEWRGEAEMRIELAQEVQSDGIYTCAIPVYDPTNAIYLEVRSADGDVLTSTSLDLRDGYRAAPYPVYDRALPRFDDRAALVDPAFLPDDWWAYDSAESVWVASSLSDAAWSALARWVMAGGSLVVITGTDFYRMDTARLRMVLPVEEPYLATSAAGTSYLTGTFEDEDVVLRSEEGVPLLIQLSNGAGTVSVVTVSAGALSAAELVRIAEFVPVAQMVQLNDVTRLLLSEERVATLSKGRLVLLIGTCVGWIAIATWIGRRHPKWGWAGLGVGIAALAVWSGFISNPATHVVELYALNTTVSVQSSVSLSIVSSSLYSRASKPFLQRHTGTVIPDLSLPRSLKGMDSYNLSTTASGSEMSILAGEVRDWRAYAVPVSVLHVHREEPGTVRISSFQSDEFAYTWLLIDGDLYPLDGIRDGTHTYEVPASGAPLATFVGEARGQAHQAAARLLDAVRMHLPVRQGVWVVAVADSYRTDANGIARKVRDLSMVLVEGTEGIHAN